MDAVKAGGKPGTLYLFTLDGCRTTPHLGSMHGFDISRVIALTGRGDLPEVVVLGVEPSVIGWSTELSPPVAEALPSLLEAAKKDGSTGPSLNPWGSDDVRRNVTSLERERNAAYLIRSLSSNPG